MSNRREKIKFVAEKMISKPVKVEFYTKSGEKVSFKGHREVKKPVRIEFYAKKTVKNKGSLKNSLCFLMVLWLIGKFFLFLYEFGKRSNESLRQ